MDFSSMQLDSPGVRNKMNDFFDTVMGLIDKRSGMINKELEKLKDDCSHLIRNCNTYYKYSQ